MARGDASDRALSSRAGRNETDPTAGESDGGVHARTWIAVFLVAGLLWRFVRYGLAFPVWGDEAALMLEVVERQGYHDLLGPLGRGQVAPLGFLAAQFTAVTYFGSSVYILRLVPLITGVVGLCLFARLSWRALSPLGGVLALGVFTATHYATRYSLDIKPYGTDLMVSALLLVLAVEWIRAPEERRWPILLTLVQPIALTLSYPAVFIAGAVGIVGCVLRFQRKSAPLDWILLATYLVTVVTSFGGVLLLSAGPQYGAVTRPMTLYWERGFPPGTPLRFAVWFFDVHTAEMMSYPFGGKNGASTLTFVLSLLGIHRLLRRREHHLLVLLGSGFALTFFAAVLGRYPYGGSARVAQHLAPAICLFAGTGIEALVSAAACPRRRRVGLLACATLLLFAVGGTARDILHPYHTRTDRYLSELMSGWERTRIVDSGTWLMDPFLSLPWHLQWYVLRGVGGDRSALHSGAVDAATLARHREWWVINWDPRREGDLTAPPRLQLANGGYVLRHTQRIALPWGPKRGIVELQRWQRGGDAPA